jgi:hypothetical protein
MHAGLTAYHVPSSAMGLADPSARGPISPGVVPRCSDRELAPSLLTPARYVGPLCCVERRRPRFHNRALDCEETLWFLTHFLFSSQNPWKHVVHVVLLLRSSKDFSFLADEEGM